MATETLYSDGNTGSGVVVLNASDADGDQDGNFASANGGWASFDDWEFTMQDTGLTDSEILGAITMVMNLRYYMDPSLAGTEAIGLDVWDDSGGVWQPLDAFNTGNQPETSDPGNYVENYDLTPYINSASELNAIKFRFVCTSLSPYGGTVYVDSMRVVTTYTPSANSGQKAHNFGFTTIAMIFGLILKRNKCIRRKRR